MAAVTPINPEIGVGREQNRIGEGFGHSDQARIREAHRNIRVFIHQPQDRLRVLVETKGGSQRTAAEEEAQGADALTSEEMERFRRGGFACEPWTREPGGLRDRPIMMPIAPIDEREDEARVNEDACGHSRSCAGAPSSAR